MSTVKPWGLTTEIYRGGGLEVHQIEVRQGGFCSLHLHEFKYNAFVVINGVLEVLDHRSVMLYAGGSYVVDPEVVHRFRGITPCMAFEIYWTDTGVDPQREDIVRFSVGGTV